MRYTGFHQRPYGFHNSSNPRFIIGAQDGIAPAADISILDVGINTFSGRYGIHMGAEKNGIIIGIALDIAIDIRTIRIHTGYFTSLVGVHVQSKGLEICYEPLCHCFFKMCFAVDAYIIHKCLGNTFFIDHNHCSFRHICHRNTHRPLLRFGFTAIFP